MKLRNVPRVRHKRRSQNLNPPGGGPTVHELNLAWRGGGDTFLSRVAFVKSLTSQSCRESARPSARRQQELNNHSAASNPAL